MQWIGRLASTLQIALETLGGVRPWPESWQSRGVFHILLGLWWAALFLAVVAFSGRSTKCIYIDF